MDNRGPGDIKIEIACIHKPAVRRHEPHAQVPLAFIINELDRIAGPGFESLQFPLPNEPAFGRDPRPEEIGFHHHIPFNTDRPFPEEFSMLVGFLLTRRDVLGSHTVALWYNWASACVGNRSAWLFPGRRRCWRAGVHPHHEN